MQLPQIEVDLNTGLQILDPSIIGALYDAYGAALFNVALRIVHSRELAEQVLQDTFVKAWHKANSYEPVKGRLFTWLLSITKNTAIDATRTTHYRHSPVTENLESLIQKPDEDVPNTDHWDVRQMVNQLDAKYSTLIDLIYFQGYTQVEIAEANGIPIGTIKTRLRHALMAIRNLYGENVTLKSVSLT